MAIESLELDTSRQPNPAVVALRLGCREMVPRLVQTPGGKFPQSPEERPPFAAWSHEIWKPASSVQQQELLLR